MMEKSAAEQIVWYSQIALTTARNVPSPCISVCRMNAPRPPEGYPEGTVDTRLCEGCFRTVDEIRGWGMLPDDRKRVIWTRLAQRAQAVLDLQAQAVPGDTA